MKNCLAVCVALAVPNLGSLMGLIGAVCLSTVGIMFPAILETLVYYHDLGPGRWILWKNVLIFVFGFAGFSTGLYTSILDIIASFE
jgi:proton-coupled amino acid transporter